MTNEKEFCELSRIEQFKVEIVRKDEIIENRDQMLAKKDEIIAKKDKELEKLNLKINILRAIRDATIILQEIIIADYKKND